MFYRFVYIVVIFNLLYEFIEMLMPNGKMKTSIKSFVSIVIFYMVCDFLVSILK